jgi:pyridoxal phosphate enzyme (YggS family)
VDAATLRRRVAENYARVQDGIANAAKGRAVTLVCVTKYAQDQWVDALLDAGATNLAENILPRGAERFDGLYAAGWRFTRHLIGAQQSRKLRMIPGHFDWLQALDRMDSAIALDGCIAETSTALEVVVQVNIAREESKHGFLPEEAEEACARTLERCPRLSLRGLMAIPPWPSAYISAAEFERGTRMHFRQMYELFARIRSNHPGAPRLDTLSLGMSQDYVWAIEEGATMVRVGSALFEGLEG